MRPRDWFSVGIRLFGVWIFYEGFVYFVGYVGERVDLFWESEFSEDFRLARSRGHVYLWYAIGNITLALFILLRAEHLTDWLQRGLARGCRR
jgi:hypothetical protein